MAKVKKQALKKTITKQPISHGRVYVTATFNNTVVTLTDTNGNTLAWGSAGGVGFKGARKATPYAAITAVDGIAQKAKSMGLSSCEVYIKGPGPGRDGAIKALRGAGVNIIMIADVTPMPHNGPRQKKRRRV